jgi:hypothetical protein
VEAVVVADVGLRRMLVAKQEGVRGSADNIDEPRI